MKCLLINVFFVVENILLYLIVIIVYLIAVSVAILCPTCRVQTYLLNKHYWVIIAMLCAKQINIQSMDATLTKYYVYFKYFKKRLKFSCNLYLASASLKLLLNGLHQSSQNEIIFVWNPKKKLLNKSLPI